MDTTPFQKVVDFNVQFGVLEDKTISPNPSVLKKDKHLIERCMKLIEEEMQELRDAISSDDYIETADALTDILYVVYGMGARLGIDLDKTFELVHQNNMSKLCSTEEEAIRTVSHYRENVKEYDSPAYRLAPDGERYVVYNKTTKKILKSIEWKPVDLRPILE